MPRKPGLLNVREHLIHIQLVIDCYKEYGDCPAFQEELQRADFFNRQILKKHNEKRAEGNRKDIYIQK